MIEVTAIANNNVTTNTIKELIKALNNASLEVAKELSSKLTSKVKYDKLSGQVLNEVSGKLKRSIKSQVINSNDQIKAIISSNLKYAAVHENGFKGSVSVKQKLMNVRNNNKISSVKKVNFPKRSFMATALNELNPQIVQYMNRGIDKELNKKGFK